MYLGHIRYFFHIYGKIEKHWKMERAVKKWKADTSQTVKKGKGKRKDSSSESKEASESEDEEIEAMFAESSESEREK